MFDAIKFDTERLAVGVPVRCKLKNNITAYGLIDKYTEDYVDVLTVSHEKCEGKFTTRRYMIDVLKEFEILFKKN